ncbi:MAG TPA: hypothetical protein VNT55_23775 [Baekduia sp.]|nr:hypothetical protein [Baekduia sp.]
MTALLFGRPRRRAVPLTALTLSAALIAGTHNLTLLMSVILLPLMLLALALRRDGDVRRGPELVRAAGAIGLGIGLTAAWLLPNLWFGRATWIAQESLTDPELAKAHELYAVSNFFSPLPARPEALPYQWIYAQGPVTVMAWAVVACGTILWIRRTRPDLALATAIGGLSLLGAALTLLLLMPNWWLHFPRVIKTIQYPFRLIPFLAMVVALMVSVALVHLRGPSRRPLTSGLVALVVVQVAAGGWLVVHSHYTGLNQPQHLHPTDIRAEAEPPSFSYKDLLAQYQFRVIDRQTGRAATVAPPAVRFADPVTSDVGTTEATGKPGDRAEPSIVWSPFVRVSGDARLTGRNEDGLVRITVTRADAAGRWQAQAEAAHPWQLIVGRGDQRVECARPADGRCPRAAATPPWSSGGRQGRHTGRAARDDRRLGLRGLACRGALGRVRGAAGRARVGIGDAAGLAEADGRRGRVWKRGLVAVAGGRRRWWVEVRAGAAAVVVAREEDAAPVDLLAVEQHGDEDRGAQDVDDERHHDRDDFEGHRRRLPTGGSGGAPEVRERSPRRRPGAA